MLPGNGPWDLFDFDVPNNLPKCWLASLTFFKTPNGLGHWLNGGKFEAADGDSGSCSDFKNAGRSCLESEVEVEVAIREIMGNGDEEPVRIVREEVNFIFRVVNGEPLRVGDEAVSVAPGEATSSSSSIDKLGEPEISFEFDLNRAENASVLHFFRGIGVESGKFGSPCVRR